MVAVIPPSWTTCHTLLQTFPSSNYNYLFLCVYMLRVYIWKADDTYQEVVLSFHHVTPKTRGVRFVNKQLYLLSHLLSLQNYSLSHLSKKTISKNRMCIIRILE